MRPNQYGIGTNFTRYWPLILSFMMGLIQFYLMARLISGDFLNSYPFISDDGFDWVAQGFGLKGIVLDGDNSVWPILRPPVFVFVTFLDAMIGTGGYLIVGAISLSVSGTALASAYLARRLHFSDFTENPKIEDVRKGVEIFKNNFCNSISIFFNNFSSEEGYIVFI